MAFESPSSPVSKDSPISVGGRAPGMLVGVGRGFAKARDALAGLFVRLGVHPDLLTVLGTVFSVCAGLCLAVGAGHRPPWESAAGSMGTSLWPLAAGLFMFLSGAMDMLDGATARLADKQSERGAFLDSSLDRISDLAVFLGCALHFAASGNVTLVTLAFLAAGHSALISYVKARADNLVTFPSVGFWQRGERYATFLVAALIGHVPAVLWLMGTLPAFTIALRLRTALRLIGGDGTEPVSAGPFARGTRGYDLATGFHALVLFFGPLIVPLLAGEVDPLGELLR